MIKKRRQVLGYSATNVFRKEHQELLRRAEKGVAALPEIDGLRCHEVARAVGQWLGLDYADGLYGAVQHTWLWVPVKPGPGVLRVIHILDVYAVGRLPIVQLIDQGFYPHYDLYKPGPLPRVEIDRSLVQHLLDLLLRLDLAELEGAHEAQGSVGKDAPRA